MNNELQKKYGLPTATALVVGIVIGSGVLFKAEKILTATGGSLPLGILAWAIGGLIMIVCAYMFSILAGRYAHVSGLVDYAEALVGRRCRPRAVSSSVRRPSCRTERTCSPI